MNESDGHAADASPSILKSSRHSKITGDFAEGLVLYWLSKHGFECARVDHTGLDLIARNPHTGELMGVSVKARSRNTGTESVAITTGKDNIDKLEAACQAFGCNPYFAFVVDAGPAIRCFIVTSEYVVNASGERKTLHWGMRDKDVDRYLADEDVIAFEFSTRTLRWWSPKTA